MPASLNPEHSFGEMGPLDATRALLRLNQKDGFDCQSCAWPSPGGRRSFAEFFENGAKALADEGTKKRVTPDFLHATLSRVAEAKRLLAWAPDVADDSGRGVRSLPADHLGCGVRVDWKNTELLAVSEPCRVLHFRQDEQRGSLPVSAFRPGNLGRTICPIVPTCATNQAAAPC